METVNNSFAVVAHPDDCLIFAKCFIDNHENLNWTIVYLTYNADHPRAKEMSSYWNARSVKTIFLGFEDNYEDLLTQKLNSWDKKTAIESLVSLCSTANQILTHNQDGEYGHIHHQVVNEAMQAVAIPKIYFNSPGSNSFDIELESKFAINLEDFPIHKDVLAMFDLTKSRYNFEKES